MAFGNPFRNVTSAPAGRVAVRRRDMPIVASDEARHYANVASIPCQMPNCACGNEGRSTVAHSNQLGDGKARSMKAPWWMVAALCQLAHHEIDHGKKFSKQQRRELWDQAHKRTNDELFARGLVRPK